MAAASSQNATAIRRLMGASTVSSQCPLPEVLHQRVSFDDHRGATVLLESVHRSKPRFQAAVVSARDTSRARRRDPHI